MTTQGIKCIATFHIDNAVVDLEVTIDQLFAMNDNDDSLSPGQVVANQFQMMSLPIDIRKCRVTVSDKRIEVAPAVEVAQADGKRKFVPA